MFLNKLANVIYTKGTASEDRQITIIHYDSGRILWFGKAKESKFWKDCSRWLVMEVLIDSSTLKDEAVPVCNRDKIITVY